MTSPSSQERTTEALAELAPVESLPAVFVSQTGLFATVNQGTTSFAVRSVSQYPPIPGEAVRLERRSDGELVMLGPSMARPAVGKILATGTPQCTVEYPPGSGVSRQMPYSSSYTPTVNDLVSIKWENGGEVAYKLSALPTVTVPGQNGPVGPVDYHPDPFTAIDSGSQRGGDWWTPTVRAGDPTSGGWFYGSKIKDTIPDGAVILSARIYLPVINDPYGYPAYLGTHTRASKPSSGPLAISGSYELPGHSGWVGIPTSFIDFLKANDGGLGFVNGLGYTWWQSVAADGLSGALDIAYRA